MTLAGTERRRRQLVTAGLGTVLTLVMGAVLVMGFRLATHMRANIAALQTASTLQTYPEEISHQLNSLRDRLEGRAYSGQALADLQATVRRFGQKLSELSVSGEVDVPQLHRALQLWHQYTPVLDPVVSYSGQPYVDSDTAGSVTLEYTVDTSGETRDVHVVEATPPGVFDQAAINAVKHWRYAPLHRARGPGADARHSQDGA